MMILFVLFVLLQIADAVMTRKVLAAGGLELNWVMDALMGTVGIVGALILVKSALIISAYLLMEQVVLMAIANLFYIAILVHNTRQMRRLRITWF